MRSLIFVLIFSFSSCASAKTNNCETIKIQSSIDAVSRSAHLCRAPNKSAPLLVFLPAWSGGHPYYDEVVKLAADRGWNFLAPKPRGAAEGEIGATVAIQDVLDAINHTKALLGARHPRRIYAIGVSGGVHGFDDGG